MSTSQHSNDHEQCIAFIVDHAASVGGAETFLLQMLRRLEPLAVHPTVILAQRGRLFDQLRERGARVAIVPLDPRMSSLGKHHRLLGVMRAAGALPSLALAIVRLWQIVRSCPSSVVYTYSIKADVYGSIAARLARKPCVWHMHDLMSPEMFPLPYRRLLTWLANRTATRVLCNSRATRQAMIDAGLRPSLAEVAYYGVETDGVVDRETATQLCAEFGASRHKIVGLIGRIAPWKGQHVLVEAIPRILDAVPDARFLIVGAAAFGKIDTDYEAGLRRRVTELGLHDHVVFTGHRNDVRGIMSCCDALVHTSVQPEAFGLAVVEAMALGKPIVATRLGGVPEFVDDGRTGRLVQPGDPSALAEAVVDILRQYGVSRSMGAEAKRGVAERFSLDKSVSVIARALRECALAG